MTAWDPHLNQSVQVRNLTINGSTHSYFNPHNFSSDIFFLSLAQFKPGLLEFEPGHQLYAFHYAVQCVLPISGVYCSLNRWLFFAEILFGLGALSLSYEWLAVISIAAALNYSAVAAIHVFVLYSAWSRRILYLTYDAQTLFEVLGVSVLSAHPLQQWSQTLQKRTFAKTRSVLACWCVLVCTAFMLADRGDFPTEIPLTGVGSSSQIPTGFGLQLKDFFCDGCYNDTINAFLLEATPKDWEKSHGYASPCPNPDPLYLLSMYSDQNLVPDLFPNNSLYNSRKFWRLDYAFSMYAIIASAATIALAFHGQHGTHFVRSKIYLWLRGSGSSKWRSIAGVLVALFYYTIQFLIGITSLPITIVATVMWEYVLVWAPTSEKPSDLGQWGPCVGALLVACVVVLKTGSTARILQNILSWMLMTPAHFLFPNKIKRRRLPRIDLDWTLLHRVQGLPRWLALFFTKEYFLTREWLRNPHRASLKCIVEEEAKMVDSDDITDKSKSKSVVTVSGTRV